MRYQACIFDLDGTLCDSVASIAHSANRALRDLGLREASAEEYKQYVGDGVDMLVRRLLKAAGDTSLTRFDELKAAYLDYFREGCLYQIRPYPGIPEALARLKAAGARLGVISNKPQENTKSVITHVFGTELFDVVQGFSADFPRKPDPAGALHVAEVLGGFPAQA